MSQLRALLPLLAVLPIEGGSPDPACSSVTRDRSPAANSGHGDTRMDHSSSHNTGPTGRGRGGGARLPPSSGRWTLAVQIWRRFGPCLGSG